jgi:hypothetical protein
MQRIAYLVLAVTMIAAAVVINATVANLPPEVASHFGTQGRANGFMTRGFYRVFMLAFAICLPLLLVAVMAWLPRVSGSINIPNRDYWLAPAQREATLSTLATFACALGVAIVMFITGLHLLIIDANAGGASPRLPMGPFFTLIGVFLAAIFGFIAAMLVRFRKAT